jgi:ABC-type branched-subunit amino acid transport system substrate-binding protein
MKGRPVRRLGLVGLVAVLGLTLAACAQVSRPAPRPSTPPEAPPPRAQPAPQPDRVPYGRSPDTPLAGSMGAGMVTPNDGMVRVGLLVPLSGPAAGIGEALSNAAQMAAFDAADGRFVLQPYDTGGSAPGAARAAQQALSQGAQLLLGPVFAGSTRAVAPVAAGAGVNVVAFTTDPSAAGGQVYVMGFLVRDQVDRMVSFAMSEGRTRFGALTPSEPYGQVATDALRGQVAARGGQLVAVQTYAPDNPDLRQPARAMAGADAVLIPDAGDGLRAAVNGLAYVDIDSRRTRYMGTMLWDDPGLWRESALAGGIFPAPSRESMRRFEARYQDAFGAAPPDLAVLGYDAAALAAVLARQPGGPRFDRAMLTSASGFAGAAGVFRFRPDGTVERGLAVMEIQQGGTVTEISPAPLSLGGSGMGAGF